MAASRDGRHALDSEPPSTPTPPTAPANPPPTGGGGGGGGGTTGVCTTADPFVSLGGGTCWNGGWLPPGDGCAVDADSTAADTDYSHAPGAAVVHGGWQLHHV